MLVQIIVPIYIDVQKGIKFIIRCRLRAPLNLLKQYFCFMELYEYAYKTFSL